MAFSSIPQTWIASGLFAIQSLFQRIKDNFDALNAVIIGAGNGGVPNGSFEIDSDSDGVPDNWTLNLYPGGSGALDVSAPYYGTSAYKFTHPGGAGNGGGYLTSDYVAWSPFQATGVAFGLKCSAAGVKVIGRLKFYDKDKLFLSNTDFYTSTANPLLHTLVYAKNIESPVAARFVKIELHGGVNDTNVAGDIYFDFVQVVGADPLPGYLPFTDSGINQAEAYTGSTEFYDVGSDQSVSIPAGTKYLYVYAETKVDSDTGTVRFRIGTAYSSELETTSGTYVGGWLFLDVSALQGTQSVRFQAKHSVGLVNTYVRCPTANGKYCKTGRIVSDMVAGTQAFDAS